MAALQAEWGRLFLSLPMLLAGGLIVRPMHWEMAELRSVGHREAALQNTLDEEWPTVRLRQARHHMQPVADAPSHGCRSKEGGRSRDECATYLHDVLHVEAHIKGQLNVVLWQDRSLCSRIPSQTTKDPSVAFSITVNSERHLEELS